MAEPTSSTPLNSPVNADAEVANLQAQAISGGTTSNLNRNAMIPNDMESLRKESPEMYRGILEGIAGTILSRMRAHDRRMKKLMREGYKWDT